ncbi:MAG: YvcK family protein [Solirubrobacterales bacterium]|nr:YvcK family protein [Solirubrobacterales bacterium]
MRMRGPVVVLAGGTGGAKLARGMADVVDDLVVIANTGDDVEIHGGYVSPDPDLISFWLADRINDRGWGLEGDTFNTMDGLRELGQEVWFNLGDRDLALAIWRAQRLAAGERLTSIHADASKAIGVAASVLPMSDLPVRTRVAAGGRWWPIQEYLIRSGWPAVEDVQFHGARQTTPEVLAALAGARAIVIGPSNPVISIGPMLAIPELAAALANATAPRVAVSPIVDGRVLKGPTAAFMRWRGVAPDNAGVAARYEGLIDGIVADATVPGVVTAVKELGMDDAAKRTYLARETLRFADQVASLRR